LWFAAIPSSIYQSMRSLVINDYAEAETETY